MPGDITCRINLRNEKQVEQLDFKKCTFSEFVELPPSERELYQTAGQLLPPDDWGVGTLKEKEWGVVKQAQFILSRPGTTYHDMLIALSLIFSNDTNIESIASLKWYDVWKFHNFVVNELTNISTLESDYLSYESSDREQSILKPLTDFGYFATLDGLADGDLTKYEAIEKMTWNMVFTKLRYDKAKAEAEKQIYKIHNK